MRKHARLNTKEREAFLHRQVKKIEKLGTGRPPLRLHEHLLSDRDGRLTSKRTVCLDGGNPDGGRDDLRCSRCQRVILQTVRRMGLPVPPRSTLLEVGARELFQVAAENRQLHLSQETFVHRGVPTEVATRRIDDLIPVVLTWLECLETPVSGGRSASRQAASSPQTVTQTPPPLEWPVLREREQELASWNTLAPHPDFPKYFHRVLPTTQEVPPVDPRMRGVTTTTEHDRTVQVDLIYQTGIVDAGEVAADLQAAGWVTDVEIARQTAREAVQREQQQRADEQSEFLKKTLREVLGESLLDAPKPLESGSPIEHGMPAGSDRLPPLETAGEKRTAPAELDDSKGANEGSTRKAIAEQRKTAVANCLATWQRHLRVTRQLVHQDFWRMTQYQSDSEFRKWIYNQKSGSGEAVGRFERVLTMSAEEFVATVDARKDDYWRPL